MTVVPVLINKTQNQALAAINEAGLKLGKLNTAFSTYPSGTVIAQSITAGTQVEQNSAISMTLPFRSLRSGFFKSDFRFPHIVLNRTHSVQVPCSRFPLLLSPHNEALFGGYSSETYIDGVPADTARQNTNGGRDK